MYFADLSPCTYNIGKNPPGLSVGWLDKEHAFPTGTVPDGLVGRLEEFGRNPAVQHRGVHGCEFCDFRPGVSQSELYAAGAVSNAVIRVNGVGGRIYYSPEMIGHYIEKHGYKPPEEFVRAVMETELPVKPLTID